ncbi:oxygenase MpaB family protein [Nocardia gipuzkoensis]|uniref:oxygenase MpaB family protein n=1 Tax=Nocardia gipuzkoensis TaxID=2749991 RepID=UPI00237ED52E|nr:oxygenase MpaB family protein [Nocardia gipuzkoensis]MDE1670863.1 oxygenase MpaB family protein [Nocardia gipuzkoensis]
MTAVAHQPDRDQNVPLTKDRTRIGISVTHQPFTKRPLELTDALDFWSFAGAAANVVMQMARPGVGYGVAESKVESGSLMKHPWKRARTTTQYLAVAILGTDEERKAYREAVNVAHRQVHSAPGAPVKYNAFDRNLQLWVAACLYIGFEDTYQLLHGRMNDEQAEAFYVSSSTLGTTLQVTEDMWPATRAAFDEYWNAACEQVVLDDYVRGYLESLLDLRMIHWYLRLPFRNLLRFLTIGFLAPIFREQLRVEWTAADQRRFENLFVFVSFVNRFIPRFVRHGGSHGLMVDLRRRMRKQKNLI